MIRCDPDQEQLDPMIESEVRDFQRQRVGYLRAETYLDAESAAVAVRKLAGNLDCPINRARWRQKVIEHDALRALEAVLGNIERALRE